MFSGLSATQSSARRWTALASFTLQVAFVSAALVFPMLYPKKLPPVFLNRRIFVPMSNGDVRAESIRRAIDSGGPAQPTVLVVPRDGVIFGKARPAGTAPGPEAPPLGPETGPGPDLGPPIGVSPTILPPPPTPSRPVRTSVVMESNLIHRVEPQYPAIAKQIRLEGAVVLKAIISRDGNIEHVEVASGPGLLARSAAEAVRQWKYRPYLLNGEPVEVETQITVNFVLEH
jgi:periplasmic protein TonB